MGKGFFNLFYLYVFYVKGKILGVGVEIFNIGRIDVFMWVFSVIIYFRLCSKCEVNVFCVFSIFLGFGDIGISKMGKIFVYVELCFSKG